MALRVYKIDTFPEGDTHRVRWARKHLMEVKGGTSKPMCKEKAEYLAEMANEWFANAVYTVEGVE